MNGTATPATSPGHLLALLRATDGLSRRELLDATGLARSTLYERLDLLFASGLAYEAESLRSTGGRPAKKVRFDDRDKVVLALDIGHTHARASVLDLSGRVITTQNHKIEISADPKEFLAPALDDADRFLEGRQLVGVGVGVPSPVDRVAGIISRHSIMPRWEPETLNTLIGSRFRVPVYPENDARAFALGEASGSEMLVAVKFASGLACGIVVDGEVLDGVGGAAGDIGHIRVVSSGGELCRCGRHGCLASVASGWALLKALGRPGVDRPRVDSIGTHDPTVRPGLTTLEELVAASADEAVEAAIVRAAESLGAALAGTVATLNPDRVVLGGLLGSLPIVVDTVRSRILSDAHPSVTRNLVVSASAHGELAPSIGLARLVTYRLYSAAAVNTRIAV
ncbi:MAG: ROK family protein [Lacisediminihabitans sp.]